MDSDNTDKLKRRSIFDDPVDLFNFSQIQPIQSPSLSYAKMIQASRSVPGSRRNSSEDHALDVLLGAKLSLNDSESGFRRLPFAMTPKDSSSIGAFSTTRKLDNLTANESEISSFNPILSQANESPIRTFANTTTPTLSTATLNNSNDYPELFAMTNINNVPPPPLTTTTTTTTTSTSIKSMISPESNTDMSWISYHQGGAPPTSQQHQNESHQYNMENARRYSYGWHTPATSSRLNQYSDPNNNNNNKDLSQVMCPQFQQFGFCTRSDVCPFAHIPLTNAPFFTSMAPQPSLYQQYNNQPQKQDPYFLSSTTLPLHQQSQQHHHHHQHHHKSNKNQHRRSTNMPEQQDRFADANMDDFIGKLYELCKDQNGCRFLQKKIEDKEDGTKNLEIVFNEIHSHFTELMTDPFGNYLCQKMLEKCNNDQRTVIVETVAPELVKIALNMHGTRAVQKLIEYLSTDQQIKAVTSSLNSSVVTLIKDLNGNHVIQKCLHRLSSENNQFIYDAVCDNCIEVASHKHGCCVLQRCFDHATIPQKDQLVNEIAHHALPLVQNPFGNYVVQYVLELGVSRYSESVIRRFVNHVCILSVQKFSSNVIENCIRTAQPETRRLLIAELVNQTAMEKLLHDSFANYVVQTSLDFADEDQRIELVECIRPLLPTIRTTPYGKRIHSKIFRDTKSNVCNKAQFTQQRQRHRIYNEDFGNLVEPHQSNISHESSYK